MSIREFSPKTVEMLKYYVYVYSDPDTREPFYVGKGKGNRAFDHLGQVGETEKINRITEIKARGKEPVIEILVHGVDEETAFKVEAAAIDLIGVEKLTNAVRGHHSGTYGKIEAGSLEARYCFEELALEDITENVMMFRINQNYRNGMEPFELYDITRGCWRVNLEIAKKAAYAFAVYDGMVMEVYSIVQWLKAGAVMPFTRTIDSEIDSGRYEFVGNIAPEAVRQKYINKSVSSLFNKGSQNPFRYFLKEDPQGQ